MCQLRQVPYGPFRDALQSAPVAGKTGRYIPPHKKEYQVRTSSGRGGGEGVHWQGARAR